MSGEGVLSQNDRSFELFVAYRGKLVTYANDIVADAGHAEDVVQEAFLRFRDATTTRSVREPVAYLYRIVRNLAVDLKRRLKTEGRYVVGSSDDIALEIAEAKPSPEATAAARQELLNLAEAMGELPERTRIALEMHRLGGCTLKEIAERRGISVSMAQVLVVEGVAYCQSRT